MSKTKEEFIDSIKTKYGSEIIKDFEEVKEKSNLSELARKYNVSREYTSQIFKKLFDIEYFPLRKKKSQEKEKKLYDIEFKMKMLKKDSLKYINLQSYVKVMKYLKLFGIKAQPTKHIKGIILNDKVKLKVKSRKATIKPSCYNKMKYFNFNVDKKDITDNDILILHVEPKDEFYILFTHALDNTHDMHAFIPDTEKQHKYSKFLNTWELISFYVYG